jgi:hypothetical protein
MIGQRRVFPRLGHRGRKELDMRTTSPTSDEVAALRQELCEVRDRLHRKEFELLTLSMTVRMGLIVGGSCLVFFFALKLSGYTA